MYPVAVYFPYNIIDHEVQTRKKKPSSVSLHSCYIYMKWRLVIAAWHNLLQFNSNYLHPWFSIIAASVILMNQCIIYGVTDIAADV